MSRKRYSCGCRKATVNRKGHAVACDFFDPERYDSHVTRRDRELTRYRHENRRAVRNARRHLGVVAHN